MDPEDLDHPTHAAPSAPDHSVAEAKILLKVESCAFLTTRKP